MLDSKGRNEAPLEAVVWNGSPHRAWKHTSFTRKTHKAICSLWPTLQPKSCAKIPLFYSGLEELHTRDVEFKHTSS